MIHRFINVPALSLGMVYVFLLVVVVIVLLLVLQRGLPVLPLLQLFPFPGALTVRILLWLYYTIYEH